MTKNIEKYEISPEQMTSKIKISNLEFKTTKDLKPFEEILLKRTLTRISSKIMFMYIISRMNTRL